ncbi:hypothetical protein HRbin12_00862 [bacterium HR12]|nr:hypothetical protein HRbin12_00862 [bacterium HR12]
MPERRAPRSGFACVTGEASVRPYPSTRVAPPVISANRSATAEGSAAPPETQALMERRSYLRVRGDSFRAMNSRGTPGTNVGFSWAMASSTRWRSRGLVTRIALPAVAIATFIASIPKEWKKGRAQRIASAPSSSSRYRAPWSAFATTLRWESIAPLETPVVPPV